MTGAVSFPAWPGSSRRSERAFPTGRSPTSIPAAGGGCRSTHVRNALARFNQVDFESDAAREQARKRLLNAAKKYRIVPVGFITRQLQSERKYATARIQATAMEAAALPTGFVTLLMSDIEGSTVLLRKLGDRYGALLNDVQRLSSPKIRRRQ